MKKDQMMTLLFMAGGIGLVYWYVTSYGPNGAVATAGGASWWDTWFGGAANPAAGLPSSSQPASSSNTGSGASSTPATSGGGAAPPQPPPATPNQQLLDFLNAAAKGDPTFVNGLGNADQWAYYYNKMRTPLTPDQFSQAFGPSRGATPMTANQFLNTLLNIGLSGVPGISRGVGFIVNTPAVNSLPTLPSMSFRGMGRTNGAANFRSQGVNALKGYLQ